jgi:glycosyltransferase involved in cell wall biosynthesis
VTILSVAVDATPLLGERTGVGEFCAGALAALARRDDVSVSAFAVSWRRRGGIVDELPPGVRAVRRPLPARPVRAAWSRSGFPHLELVTGSVDVVHGTNFVVPPTRRAARVVTVHDLTTVRYPELCEPANLAFPHFVRRAISEGAFVHTPSAFVAAEVVEHFGADPERVRAVLHGAPSQRPAPGAASEAIGGPYVLALGTVEPRKDLPSLVAAFDLLAAVHPELHLVVAGRDGWGSAALDAALDGCAARDRVLRLGYVGRRERDELLVSASVFCFPSLYEGFGMPPLEAMAAGVPVVTTTAGAIPEVVADAALLVAPRDPEALAGALGQALEDEGLRARLRAAGAARVASLTWDGCAEGLARLYCDSVEARRQPGRAWRAGHTRRASSAA